MDRASAYEDEMENEEDTAEVGELDKETKKFVVINLLQNDINSTSSHVWTPYLLQCFPLSGACCPGWEDNCRVRGSSYLYLS